MSEFDLDPQIRGAAGFGWEAHCPSTEDEADVVFAAWQGSQSLT